jgi:3-deoxy-manno-octulosonate cytidylyltransferase (CMP-KDO synthetase)
MIRWVHEGVSRCRTLDEVRVATDDERIRACVEGFGGLVAMTAPHHPTGTDRLAEAAADLPEDAVVVNVQGDEPLVEPEAVDEVVRALLGDPEAEMATLATALTDAAAFSDPSVVKVVRDARGRALYFSRAPIPWPRATAAPAGAGGVPRAGPPPPEGALRHLGLYAHRTGFLRRFCAWGPSPLERLEGLEQLRALEHGARVRVALTDHASLSIDTPGDVAAVVARLRERLASEAG